MKKIHPKIYSSIVKCACGNTFTLKSTLPSYQVEVCWKCHPFFTGQMKFVDTAGRVDAFIEKQKKAKEKILSKREKRQLKKLKKIQEEFLKPESLQELRNSQ